MGWLGSILGGGLGYMLGGPLGAVIGAALGHSLGSIGGSASGRGDPPDLDRDQLHAVYFTALFSMLGKLAKADGVVSREEIELVDRFMTDVLGFDRQARSMAIKIFQAAKDSPEPFESYAAQFSHVVRDQNMLYSMLELLVAVAMADGVLHPNEERMLEEASRIFGIPLDMFEHLKGARGDDLETYYKRLGASPDDSMDEIRRKYRKLAHEYHPDTIMNKGLPEEFVKFANQKFQEIQEAYDKIKEARAH